MNIKSRFTQIVFSICIFIIASTTLAKKYEYPFQNPKLSTEERVDDLISRLSLEEKMEQLKYDASEVNRLGIPSYNWWSECLHGVARNGKATVFPQAIAMAATFDDEMMHRIGGAIADEGRAKYNANSTLGNRAQYQGLTFWTPNVNIFRDPRWGRGQETYGEDPILTSKMSVQFVKGLQGNDPDYIKAAGCAKHYAVHSGPEGLRHEFDAVVSMRDMWDTYLPAFEALVTEAKVEGVMGAYNRTNGYPCCAHPYLMMEILREKWDFKGYFTSDCWAINDFHSSHKVSESVEESLAMALQCGCNLNCGSAYQHLASAMDKGLITEADIDRNLRELLPTRFRLGLFNLTEEVPFKKISTDVIGCDKHKELALEAARKSIVMLKNNNNLLPLDKNISGVYLCGPMAIDIQVLLGNYYGINDDLVTILEGVSNRASKHTNVRFRQGALLNIPNINPIDWYSGEAAMSEVTIACIGITELLEGEEGESIASPTKGDRFDLNLPENQMDLLRKLRKNTEKLVVVLTGGSPITCPEIYELADAMLFVWYPGEQGGNAVADVIFGNTSPSGRMPITTPFSAQDLPPYEDYNMTGRTYRYMDKEALFPFGFGLSYTDFEYRGLKINKDEITLGDSIDVQITIKNNGKMEAEEVVQLYITDLEATVPVAKYALKDFKRVSLKQRHKKTVKFRITPEMMQIVNEKGERIIESGKFRVTVSSSSPSQRSIELGAPEPVSCTFTVK